MYEKQLAKDLKKAFAVKKVVFNDFDDIEQRSLVCNISTTKQRFRRGGAYFRVIGDIGLIGNDKQLKSGYIREKYNLTSGDIKTRLKLIGREDKDNILVSNRMMKKFTHRFVYIIKIDYNPAKPMAGINIIIEFVKGLLNNG